MYISFPCAVIAYCVCVSWAWGQDIEIAYDSFESPPYFTNGVAASYVDLLSALNGKVKNVTVTIKYYQKNDIGRLLSVTGDLLEMAPKAVDLMFVDRDKGAVEIIHIQKDVVALRQRNEGGQAPTDAAPPPSPK